MNVVGTTFFFHFSAGGHRSCYAALLNREVKRRDTLRKPSFQFTIASDRGFELSIVMVRSILSLQFSLNFLCAGQALELELKRTKLTKGIFPHPPSDAPLENGDHGRMVASRSSLPHSTVAGQ